MTNISAVEGGVSANPKTVNSCPQIDENKLLKVVKRLFDGSIKETLGELFQNSQRAGAKVIAITATQENSIIISDDGAGLSEAKGVEMFSPLMRIAESGYEREEVLAQDPMGVGFFSLLSLKGVLKVTVSSRGLSLETETEKLFNEAGYWQSWRNRVQPSDFSKGLKLEIECSAELVGKIRENLAPLNSYHYLNRELERAASGYEGILEIFLDGEKVDTSCPHSQKLDMTFLETEYRGNCLKIGANRFSRSSIINWYGQLIRCDFGEIGFYLEVKKGRPVNPMSPSRRGIIADELLDRFKAFLIEKLWEYVLHTPRENIHPKAVSLLYSADKEKADAECPYFTASRLIHDEAAKSYDNWTTPASVIKTVRYDEAPILLDTTLSVVTANISQSINEALARELGDGTTADDILELCEGAVSFVPVIENAFGAEVCEFKTGNSRRIELSRVFWKPSKTLEEIFVERGKFALVSKAEAESESFSPASIPLEDWHDVTETVFGFDYAENWNIISCEGLTADVRDNIGDKLSYLNSEAWCAWTYQNDDYDSETMEDDYRKSLEEMKARLFSDCIPDEAIELYKLGLYFKLKEAEKISKIEFEYGENAVSRYFPAKVIVTGSEGTVQEKTFLSALESSAENPIKTAMEETPKSGGETAGGKTVSNIIEINPPSKPFENENASLPKAA